MPLRTRFLDRVRQFNKRTFNPWILQSAGTARSPFAVVGHIGRRSGRTYATPVIVRRAKDGFAFALTYGPEVDWYRNILAAGSCTLGWGGKTYVLEHPEPMSAEAGVLAFPFPLRWVLKLNRIRHFFRMSTRQADDGGPGPVDSIGKPATI
jgi:deazaflavin-dependent oxidoreductase (nitroreductase family)